tara:strand:+ start:367 stop:705 length:339 start_codon:yes stop_codon:yes gene_type:complete
MGWITYSAAVGKVGGRGLPLLLCTFLFIGWVDVYVLKNIPPVPIAIDSQGILVWLVPWEVYIKALQVNVWICVKNNVEVLQPIKSQVRRSIQFSCTQVAGIASLHAGSSLMA